MSPGGASEIEQVRQLLAGLLAAMGIPASVEARPQGECGVHLTVRADEVGALVGPHGQTLDALQYLMNRMVRRRLGDPWFCIVDAGGFREQRQHAMACEARDIAERVRRTGRPFTFPPLSAADRRAIHRALVDDPDIETVSLEPAVNGMKRLVVRLRTPPAAGEGAPAAPAPPSAG
ncbi:MAG: KH domain-containing protein [Kiritimatiellae bacterium]|nr:KH domain-containing protein [Kiritimatiellia bacterium]